MLHHFSSRILQTFPGVPFYRDRTTRLGILEACTSMHKMLTYSKVDGSNSSWADSSLCIWLAGLTSDLLSHVGVGVGVAVLTMLSTSTRRQTRHGFSDGAT